VNPSDWIALSGEIITVVGAATVGISKLARIAAAAEQLGTTVEKFGAALESVGKTVQDHETRLSAVEKGSGA
jgi:hypothetical protein